MASDEKDNTKKDSKNDNKDSKKEKQVKEPNDIFKLDAKVLLAKLHLAAAGQIRGQCQIVKNTAILNEKQDDVPDTKNDCTFDLKSGPDYIVAVFLKLKDYVPAYESITKDYKKIVTDEQKIDSDKIKEIEDKLEKENDQRKKDQEGKLDKLKAESVKLLQTYFLHFAGKEASRKIDAKSTQILVWPNPDVAFDKITGKGKKLDNPDEKELAKVQEELLQKFKEEAKKKTEKLVADPIEQLYCFYTGYSTTFG